MLYRRVPKNGDELSVLGFGAMRLPQKRMRIDEKRATRQIYSLIDAGVNYIDTAVPYHMGKSEPFLGKVLSQDGYRKKVKLATKMPHWSAGGREDMGKFLDAHLSKLRTDRIDYYLIHSLIGETWERIKKLDVIGFLEDALASGKILNAGFSFHGASKDFRTIVDDYDWTFCLVQYNFLDTKNQAGTAGVKYAASKDMAVMVMEPLRGGNLARKPPAEVQRIWDRSETRRTPAEWALRWLWNHPEVTVVLSGMNEEDHIEENLRIASEAEAGSLSEKDLELVSQAADAYRSLMKAGCTSCQYCMPCPAGVNIPGCFEYYNSYTMFRDKLAKFMYLSSALGGGSRGFASQCTACGVCVKKCPQNLPIPELMKDVKKDMEGFLTRPLIWILKKLMRVKA